MGHKRDLQSAIGREGGGGHSLQWESSDATSLLLKRFRNAVINQNADAVKSTIVMLGVSESEAENIALLLINRSSAEPTKEALLTAITTACRPLVEYILPLFYEFPGEERNGCCNSEVFPSHVTPLMLACICNNFAIVECLLMRNHSVMLPHRPDCDCDECFRNGNSPEIEIIRLDTYRAISSDAFLWLACEDPLLAACWLAKDLEICSKLENNSREVYRGLRESVMKFGLKLVQYCWSMEEVDLLLSRKHGVALSECSLRLPRARLALDSQMKYLTTSLNVQMAIHGHWCGDWTGYGRQAWDDLQRILTHTVFYPVFASVHAFSAGRLVKSFKNPIARYLSKTTSYVVFLMTLLFVRHYGRSGSRASDRAIRGGGTVFGLECYLYLYVFGMVIAHYQDFARRGIRIYYKMWWRWFDLLLFWLFSGSFYCWIVTVATVAQDGLTKLHRRHWVFYDFSIIYDVYFGGACIMAFWRIFFFVQLRRDLGSTVISICHCAWKVISYLSIMAVVMLCFAFGINALFQSYTGCKGIDPNGKPLQMKRTFSDIIMAFRNEYWAYYGYLGPKEYTVIPGNVGPNQEVAEHHFIVIAGEVIVGLFYIVVIVLLRNLMISMLVRTAGDIQQNEGIEWKFTRCQIYFEYFEWYSAVPPPFNLILSLTNTIRRYFKHSSHHSIYPGFNVRKEFVDIDIEDDSREEMEYKTLLKTVFQRFRSSLDCSYRTVFVADAENNLRGA